MHHTVVQGAGAPRGRQREGQDQVPGLPLVHRMVVRMQHPLPRERVRRGLWLRMERSTIRMAQMQDPVPVPDPGEANRCIACRCRENRLLLRHCIQVVIQVVIQVDRRHREGVMVRVTMRWVNNRSKLAMQRLERGGG